MRYLRAIFSVCSLALLAGCGHSGPAPKPPYPGIKIGKPYEISGRWYNPAYDAHYDEIGVASWYGPGFHGGHTANGDRFDQDALTAAHRTLPMPSIVRVTNLGNGRSALIVINDRGPFSRSRIIDLSRASAAKLDVIRTGTAKVRVQFLERETREYVANLQRGAQYAASSLKGVDPKEAGEFEAAQHRPEYRVEENMFDDDSSAAPASAPPAAGSSPDVFSVLQEAHAEPAPGQPQRYMPAASATPGTLAAPVDHGFLVLAGTYSKRQNADYAAQSLAAYGHPQVMEIVAGGRHLYRVMMGPYAAPEDAKNMLSKLTALGIADAQIIRN